MTCLAHRNRLAKAAALAVVVIASSACLAQGRTIGSPDPFSGTSAGRSGGSGEISIQVRNSNFNDATVYAVRVGARRRLGRVGGASNATFKIPWTHADRLHFEVDLLASRNCVTNEVIVDPGQTVLLNIETSSRPTSTGRMSFCDIQPLR